MHLRKVTLFNFKNYESSSFEFDEGLNCILGDNGAGKTNLLDSIHVLSLTKSFFSTQDIHNLRTGQREMSIKAEIIQKGSIDTLLYIDGLERKKTLDWNGKIYERLSDHIGRFPVILVHPHDVDIIRMGSDLRRRFFDTAISQENSNYLNDLIKYNRLLKQRNGALKAMKEQGRTDDELLDSYDGQLFEIIPGLSEARSEFVIKVRPALQAYYGELADNKEAVEINYVSQVQSTDFWKDFRKCRDQDVQASRTSMGIHKDDFEFLIDKEPIKTYGSQGQQKTFMMALKLCPLEFSRADNQPILLLDDVFDRLDTHRITALMHMIMRKGNQVFLTDARPERVRELLVDNNLEGKMIEI